jgi:hypothetical protein
MNRLVSTALAGAMALSAIGVSATSASADRWHHHDYRGGHNDVGPAIVGGAILGLAVGSMLAEPAYPAYPVYPERIYLAPPPPPPPPEYYAYDDSEAHFQWCSATYETYNGETDSWVDYRGLPHRCVGP